MAFSTHISIRAFILFLLSSLFSFFGIYGKVKIKNTKEDDQIEIFPNTGLLISIR